MYNLVLEVTGRLRPGLGPIDLLRAAFPGGIVADSDPAGEYAETLHKAEGLLRALR